jgi:hypothetical protein
MILGICCKKIMNGSAGFQLTSLQLIRYNINRLWHSMYLGRYYQIVDRKLLETKYYALEWTTVQWKWIPQTHLHKK